MYVSGLGSIGLLAVSGLAALGCRVIGGDPRADRRALGLELGCEATFDPTAEDPFEATLSFLGLGVVPPTPSWGNMLADAMAYYKVAWWFVVFPGAALAGTTIAFNVIGDSVRDAIDPRTAATSRARAAGWCRRPRARNCRP